MKRPTPEQWRRLFAEPGNDVLPGGERFVPLRRGKGLSSGEHFVRYLFASSFCEGKRVLDVACGSGYGSYILKILGSTQVTGLDNDPAAVAWARQAYGGERGLDYFCGDACGLPANLALPGPAPIRGETSALEPQARAGPAGTYDVIVSFETLEHVSDPESFLQSIRNVLSPQGLLIISCPHDAKSPWPSPFHRRRFTFQEFHSLISSHFPAVQAVAGVHGIASLVLPVEDSLADDLHPASIERTYLDFAKPVEESDFFVLLCGPTPEPVQPAAVITKNLSELLGEIYQGAQYIRERVPELELQLERATARSERQTRQLLAQGRALDDQKAYTLELQQNLDAMLYSRTWQMMLACREALKSPGKLLFLPAKMARILVHPPAPPVEATGPASAVLPQYLPHRRSEIQGWPADRPLVTVSIPCFNYGRFLREAIDSVLASTFQDLEIIVVDDGSTEAETVSTLRDLASNPPAWAAFRVVHQQNQGLAAARNKGAALAQGKYVVSLDADDRLHPTYLEKAAWVLEHHPEYAFCYSYVQMFGGEETIWKTQPFSLEKAIRYNHVPTGAMFRREAWVEAGGFRDELYGQDDWNFWIGVGAKGWDGCLIEEPLFFYRKHETSMWSALKAAEKEQTAKKIQAMNSYITGQGDSHDAEEFCRPKDPVVRAALDQPVPRPAAGISLAERPHLKFGDGKPALLVAVPWMAIGGAEQVVLHVMHGLSSDYHLAACTTLDARHNWEAEFEHLTPWIYHMAHLPLDHPAGFLRDLVTVHNISAILISGSALAYHSLSLLKEVPHVWTADIVHNTVPEGHLENSIRSDRYLDCHFAVGGPQRDALIRRGVAAEKISLAPTSVDAAERFNPASYAARLPEIRRQLGLTGAEIVLTYTGRLAAEKDVPLFVRIVGELVRAHPGKRFMSFIVGDGPERARVEHQIRSLGLTSSIRLLGFSNQVPEILAASRFAFLTSRFEGSSITLLEAMSMRLVMFSTETGNVRDVIEDGVSGFVIPSRDASDFAARVAEVLADPAREAGIGARARQTVLERFDVSLMVHVYQNAIAQGLAASRQPA